MTYGYDDFNMSMYFVNRGLMNNKTLALIIVIFGGLILYSKQEYAWIISAISIGIGTGMFFWKDKENGKDK